jgi:four helix bundle protein
VGIKALERLQVWVRAKDYALRIYRAVLPILPAEEKSNLAQQLRRSSLSVPANLAEGHGRFYFQDNVRFCYNTRGSLDETLSHLAFAHEIGCIPDAIYASLEQEGEEIGKMINGYVGYLKKSRYGANEPGAQVPLREEQADYVIDPGEYPEDNSATDL